MDLSHIVGSLMVDGRIQPFVLDVTSGKVSVGEFVQPAPEQAGLPVLQQQRFAQLIAEGASVGFSQVRMGQYYCTSCGRWVDVTKEPWSRTTCLSCALSRGQVLRSQPPLRADTNGEVESPPLASLDEPERRPAAPSEPVPADVPSYEEEEEREEQPAVEAQAALEVHDEKALLERAIAIAVEVHRGQQDKAGTPYILHPLRLMLLMKKPPEQMAAVLHDVVEDSEWTLDRLRQEGFSYEVVAAVDALTRREGEPYDAFVRRAAQNPIARRVKLADIEDNLDIRRLGPISEKDVERLKRYQTAWRLLVEH